MNFFRKKSVFLFPFAQTEFFVLKRQKYYLTTPIFYVNAKPHIGHLYTSVLADALCRFLKIKTGDSVRFMTGTDEHGLKIQQAAEKAQTEVSDYVKNISDLYKTVFSLYSINYDEFVRTTDPRHKECVYHIWKTLKERGHIYQGEYSGWYCTADEAFIPEIQLQTHPDGSKTTADGNRPVEFVSEVNYKFRLSSFREKLLEWLKGDVIQPHIFLEKVRGWVHDDSGLQDVSVSRPKTRVPWGLSVPDDPSQTIYVWLDALCSYLTGVGAPGATTSWPPDVQIVGKDILKFHSIYWPAFLMAAGLEPPRKILCHSHWLVDGQKMSKTAGNVVDPAEQAEKFTSEGFRYFLLREAVPHNDSNYSSLKVQRTVNSELADTLGNLLNRCTGKLVNSAQVFPAYNAANYAKYCSEPAQKLREALESLPDTVDGHYSQFELHKAVDAVMAVLHLANALFENEKPWELRKRPESAPHLSAVLHITMETIRVCGILLSPIIPVLSDQLLTKLSIPVDQRKIKDILPFSWQQQSPLPDRALSDKQVILFQRIK